MKSFLMKRRALKLVVSLMLILAVSFSVLAYDTQSSDHDHPIPSDVWSLRTVYHWVSRGDTLQSIATAYGTTTARIRANNAEYFADLDARNKTWGVDFTLDLGVRLAIYDVVNVVHYVRRGDTLAGLANGALVYGTGVNRFQLITTTAAIKAENWKYFDSLAKLNSTQKTNFELVESDVIYDGWYTDPYSGWVYQHTTSGTPLSITVPVWVVGTEYGPTWSRSVAELSRTLSESNPADKYNTLTSTRTIVGQYGNVIEQQLGNIVDVPTGDLYPTTANANQTTAGEFAGWWIRSSWTNTISVPWVLTSDNTIPGLFGSKR